MKSYIDLKVGDLVVKELFFFRISKIYQEGDKTWFNFERLDEDFGWTKVGIDVDEVGMQNNIDKGRVYREINKNYEIHT